MQVPTFIIDNLTLTGTQNVTTCTAPTLTAEANGSTGQFAACPRAGLAALTLTANPKGGSGCTGSIGYSWSNGSNYWDGKGFNLTSPAFNEAYDTITVASKDSVNYIVMSQCSGSTSCTSSSSIITTILTDVSTINASIGAPANGASNYMLVKWSKVAGADYTLEFSKDNTNWTLTGFTGSGTSYEHNTGEYPNSPCFYQIQAYTATTKCGDWVTLFDTAYTACDYPVLTAGNAGMDSLVLTLGNDNNPAYTLYSIQCQTTGQYVQKDGTLDTAKVYLSKEEWGATTGSANGVITVRGLTPETNYCFYASAKNRQGNIQTQGPALTICAATICNAPVITSTYPANGNTLRKCTGDTVNFKVAVSKEASAVSYQWLAGGNVLSGSTGSEFSISKAALTDENVYNCIISYTCQSITSNNMVLLIDSKPVMNVSAILLHDQAGDTIEFSVTPTGSESFTYQWLLDGNPIAGATNNIYIKDGITSADAGIYYCDASDECGSTIATIATLVVGNSTTYGLYGTVTYDNKASTVLDKTVVTIKNLENTYNNSVTTDTTGHFIFTNLSSDTYIITANTSKAWGGGNPLDALLVNRYFIKAITAFGDALKKSAADVNSDDKINPIDALLINRRFIRGC